MRELRANKSQLLAIFHEKGPARVIAGPGSGKTFTIIQRILYLIRERKVSPGRILTITFTKAAAMEMQTRYLKQISKHTDFEAMQEKPCFGTLHSLGYAILRESGTVGYTLLSESRRREILEQLLRNAGLDQLCDFDSIQLLLAEISRRKNNRNGKSGSDLMDQAQAQELMEEYQAFLQEKKLIDFDDMIFLCVKELQKNQKLLASWQQRFSFIQVDEFQDVNEMQYEMIRLLSATHQNLFVVGDDDQAIYSFRGSSPRIMNQFLTDYPQAVSIQLEENYRCRENIVRLATRVIEQNEERVKKESIARKSEGTVTLYQAMSKREELGKLIQDMKELSREELSQSAVILRTNRAACDYREWLKAEKLPVAEQKTKPNRKAFIIEDYKNFLLYLRGHQREHFLKIMDKLQGDLSQKALLHEKAEEEAFLSYYRRNPQMCQKIRTLFQQLKIAEDLSPTLAIRFFRKVLGYDQWLKTKGQELTSLLEQADRIQELFREMKAGEEIEAFLEKMERREAAKNETVRSCGISVLTMHASKGLEYKNVFLPDLNEGVIPVRGARSKEAVEEERRLLYVAITRAIDRLYLYDTKERGRVRTRFLQNIILPQK